MASLRKTNVVVMDMDDFARNFYRSLISRDPRFCLLKAVSNPMGLMEWLAAGPEVDSQVYRVIGQKAERKAPRKVGPLPDMVILSAEYSPYFPSLKELLEVVRKRLPKALIICLSNWPAADLVLDAVVGGANGFFLKGEISLGLLHGARRASLKAFLYTSGLRAYLPTSQDVRHAMPDRQETLLFEAVQVWRPMDGLSPRQREAFRLRYIEGNSAQETADEMVVSIDAVNKYASAAWSIVYGRICADPRDMEGIAVDELSREQAAFLLYTALPGGRIPTPSVV